MPIKDVVTSNLRRAQAFDKELKAMGDIDKLAEQFADSILFEPAGKKRTAKIKDLVSKAVAVSEKKILPQAETIGRQNATDILSQSPSPGPADILNESARKLALFKGRQRFRTRLQIIKESVDASGRRLDARLTRFFLEPAEGSEKDKIKRLREIHNRLEKRRKDWEKELQAYADGKVKKRPAPPKLDFLSEMVADAKAEIRTQARRVGTDTETAVFQSAGYKLYVWITPNGASACPDCQLRQNVVLSMDQWETYGRPGSGLTVCGTHCFCMLLPLQTVKRSPGLLRSDLTEAEPVNTTPTQLAVFRANRATAGTIGAIDKAAKATGESIDRLSQAKAVTSGKPEPAAVANPKPAPPPAPEPDKRDQYGTAKEWVDSLSEPETDGLRRFQGAHYRSMRRYQNGDVKPGDPGYEYIKEGVEGLESATARAPKWEGTAYRGIRNLTPEQVAGFKEGNAVTLDAHSSFSAKEEIGLRFAADQFNRGKESILFRAKMKTGVDIRPIDDFEQEIIGPKGQRFVVTKIERTTLRTKLAGQDTEVPVTVVEMEESPGNAKLGKVRAARKR